MELSNPFFNSFSAPINDIDDINESDNDENKENEENINIINDELKNEVKYQDDNDKIPPLILEFNENHENPLMISSSINSLIDFKTKNFRGSDELRKNPDIFNLYVEYKKDFKRNFISWFNKLSIKYIENFDNLINFINNCFYNEFIIKQMIFEKIFNDLNNNLILKDNIIETYCILLNKLKETNDYNYSFKFDNKFLNIYVNTENKKNAIKYNYFINNIATFINYLDKYKLIADDDIFIFLDTILLNPNYNNFDFTSFCHLILNIIHGINKEKYYAFGLYNASRRYLLNKNNIIDIFENIANEIYEDKNKPIIYKILKDILINVINGKSCCELCIKRDLERNNINNKYFIKDDDYDEDDYDEDNEENNDYNEEDDEIDESALTYN